MVEKTIVERAGEAVGFGVAMTEDVAGVVKTAFDAAVTTVTDFWKTEPATKIRPKRAAKTVPAKKAAKRPPAKKAVKKAPANKSASKTSTKKAVKKAPAKKAAAKKKPPATKVAKRTVKKTAKNTARRRQRARRKTSKLQRGQPAEQRQTWQPKRS